MRPALVQAWDIGVLYGPHGAPDYFTAGDMETLFATDWQVHYNSNRTGVRLIGPKPEWARPDGGEAGLHPSNIHDNAYAIGAVDFTGDMPILLGPDGPSLGGFVCPATIVQAELWKMGQLKPGDTVPLPQADRWNRRAIWNGIRTSFIRDPGERSRPPERRPPSAKTDHRRRTSCILHRIPASGFLPGSALPPFRRSQPPGGIRPAPSWTSTCASAPMP